MDQHYNQQVALQEDFELRFMQNQNILHQTSADLVLTINPRCSLPSDLLREDSMESKQMAIDGNYQLLVEETDYNDTKLYGPVERNSGFDYSLVNNKSDLTDIPNIRFKVVSSFVDRKSMGSIGRYLTTRHSTDPNEEVSSDQIYASLKVIRDKIPLLRQMLGQEKQDIVVDVVMRPQDDS